MSALTLSPTLRRASALLLVLMVTAGWTEPARPARGAAEAAPTVPASHEIGRAARDFASSRHDKLEAGFTAAIDLQERSAARVNPPIAEKPARVSGRPVVSVRSEAKAEAKQKAKPHAARKPSYTGTNRFWIPSLGMNHRVRLYECSRTRPPDNYLYRWGCAGTNNVYLLGHAYSVMKPLHDAYVRGKLKVGMVAIYANGNGKVTYYRVTQWRVVDPVDSEWAIASQRVPSMTLQTCVGKDSRYRLNVRLVAFK